MDFKYGTIDRTLFKSDITARSKQKQVIPNSAVSYLERLKNSFSMPKNTLSGPYPKYDLLKKGNPLITTTASP
ncbi:MAG: hypothetical protein CR994_00840 [Maribacter sp.]|nr:MAG: hypothetical protein CR994_00840 [Maribacter sp.]